MLSLAWVLGGIMLAQVCLCQLIADRGQSLRNDASFRESCCVPVSLKHSQVLPEGVNLAVSLVPFASVKKLQSSILHF